jgi:YtkA-like
MRYLFALAASAAALLAPGAALAGGWATVGVAPLPDDVAPGATWSPEITILQHGRTPLDGLSPTVTIRDEEGASHSSTATPSEESGVYLASVVFPEAGRWGVVVDSGFGDSRLTFGPVRIGDGASSGSDLWSLPTGGLAVAAALALLAGGAIAARRSRRLTPASR